MVCGPISLESSAGVHALNTVRAHLPSHLQGALPPPVTLTSSSNRSFSQAVIDATPPIPPIDDIQVHAIRIDEDRQGATHLRLQLWFGAWPLFGEHIIAQIRNDGHVEFKNTHHVLLSPLMLTMPSSPLLIPERIGEIAQRFAQRLYDCDSPARLDTLLPITFRTQTNLRLAYFVQLSDFCSHKIEGHEYPILPQMIINAESGTVYTHWNQTHGYDPRISCSYRRHKPSKTLVPPVDDYADLVGSVQLETTATEGGFELRTPDNSAETRDAQTQHPNQVAGRFELGVPFIDSDDTWGGPDASEAIKAAVETHYSTTTFLKFLEEVFNLRSLDNQDTKIQALTNVGTNYNNAFWYNNIIHIGHGDGQTFGRLSSIDIIGHELAHGITEKSAGLIYRHQSGGLNESYSDVIGVMFEWWHTQQDGSEKSGRRPFEWKIGEDSFTPSGPNDDALRYMDDPVADGRSLDHLSMYQDHIDVHFSSGIPNNAFYLTVEGGTHRLGKTVEGLNKIYEGDHSQAMLTAGQVWMHALQYYLQPSSGFREALQATLLAAQDLYPGQPAIQSTLKDAWEAVGVVDTVINT